MREIFLFFRLTRFASHCFDVDETDDNNENECGHYGNRQKDWQIVSYLSHHCFGLYQIDWQYVGAVIIHHRAIVLVEMPCLTVSNNERRFDAVQCLLFEYGEFVVAVRIDFASFETPRNVSRFWYRCGEAFELQCVTDDTELLLIRRYLRRLFHENVCGGFDFGKTSDNRFAEITAGCFVRNGDFQFLLRAEDARLVVQLDEGKWGTYYSRTGFLAFFVQQLPDRLDRVPKLFPMDFHPPHSSTSLYRLCPLPPTWGSL